MSVFLCAVDIHGLDPNRGTFAPLLSQARQAKLARISHFDMRRQSIGAELALAGAMRMRDPAAELPIAYAYAPDGAPIMSGGLYMSLSHTSGMAACAVSDMPVGVDVEFFRCVPEALAGRFLSRTMQAEYAAAKDKPGCLLRLWTQWEAKYKCGDPDAPVRSLTLPGGCRISIAGKGIEDLFFARLPYQFFCWENPLFLYGGKKTNAL